MRTGSVAFLLGVLALCRMPELPSALLFLLLPAAFCLGSVAGAWRWPAFFLYGFLWALLRGDVILARQLDPAFEGDTVQAEGRIDSLPGRHGRVLRFDFVIDDLKNAAGRSVPSPGKVRLSWYESAPELVPGERWHLPIRLKRPVGFMNPGGLDYEGWLFQNGIRATGYVVDRRTHGRIATARAWNVDLYRHLLRERLERVLGDRPGGTLIVALAMGDQGGISADQWRVMTRTGTNHLLAISGLHIGFVAGLVFLLARWLWPLFRCAADRIAAQRVAALAALGGAVIYSALAGFSVPTQRTLIMIGAWSVVQMLDRRIGMSEVLALALLAVLIFDPFSVLAPGFWLSFAAVAAIAWGMGCRIGKTGVWWRWGRVQVVVSVGLLPLLVLWFQQVPLLSIPANLIAVPWITLVTVPLVLLACVGLAVSETLAEGILHVALLSLDGVWRFLEILSDLEFSILPLPSPGAPALILALIGAAILLLPRGVPGRWLGAVWMLPLFFPVVPDLSSGELRLTLLDVGQGLAAVVRTRNHTLLYDTGPRFSGDFSAGRAAVLPYLRQMGTRRVDLLVQSHGDMDHIGGLSDVLDGIPVEQVITSVPEQIPFKPVTPCRAGMGWAWDGVEFRMLHPPARPLFGENDRSCVLQVRAGATRILLTGDIERKAEQSLHDRYGNGLRSEILVAPHHGSATSSTPAFIGAVDPDHVLIPAGYRNRFGFPKQAIIERYQRHGTRILDTARSGAIEIEIDDAGLLFRSYRQASRRFWHSRLDNLSQHSTGKP